MKIDVGGLEVHFPFPQAYPEQLEYMAVIKDVVDNSGHGLVEMPTGSGKTASFFAVALSYQAAHPDRLKKIICCTRTLSQLEKATEELRAVERELARAGKPAPKSTVLSARKNLCLHPEVSAHREREKVDGQCRLTVRKDCCDYYRDLHARLAETPAPAEVLNIEDLRRLGSAHTLCPYYTARAVAQSAGVVVCNYPYLFDDSVNRVMLRDLPRESLVIVDEAHNIDEVCIDAKSFRMDKHLIDAALYGLDVLAQAYEARKATHQAALEAEYAGLLRKVEDPALRARLEAARSGAAGRVGQMPGSIRKVTTFFSFLRRLLSFLLGFLRSKDVQLLTPLAFLARLTAETMIDEAALLYASARLTSLTDLLELSAEELGPLGLVLRFGETLAAYREGFRVIYEPYYDTGRSISPLLQLACLDASLGLAPLLAACNSVVLTSGTLSPLPLYARVIGIAPHRLASIQPSTHRNCFAPLAVARANDQTPLTSEFSERGNSAVSKNFGELLCELAAAVPDGLVVFFPSYSFLEETLADWSKSALLEAVLRYKLVFIESRDQTATSLALQNYKRAIERGRGAVFLCVARGKVAEGVDFKDHLGRCALVLGVPFQYARSRALLCRMEFLEKTHGITQKQFLHFDAMKQVAQCLGRVIRGKNDYGIMILADRRYDGDKLALLPLWIRNYFRQEHTDLQSKVAVALTKKFFVDMARG